MFGKLSEASSLLVRHFGLIAALVLTVQLPCNLLLNYLIYFAPNPPDEATVFRLSMFFEGVLGPIYIGAMIHALWQIKQEQIVGYGEAIGIGFRNWGRLFAARFFAGLYILVGVVALVIPGIVLALRYALLDCVVIVEEEGSKRARERSTQLTQGIKLPILVMAVLFWIGFLFVSMMVYFPIYFAAEHGQIGLPVASGLEVAADCVLDLVFAILQIAIFLYYWDMRVLETPDEEPEPSSGSDALPPEDPGAEQPEIDENPNPYRSPQV